MNENKAAEKKSGMSNLAQRSIVAIIGIPVVAWLVLTKPLGLLGILAIIGGLAVHEFYGLAKAKGFRAQTGIGVLMTVLTILAFGKLIIIAQFISAPEGSPTLEALKLFADYTTLDVLALVLVAAMISTFTAELFSGFPNPLNHVSFTLGGIVYVGTGVGAVFGVWQYLRLRPAFGTELPSIDPGPFVLTMLSAIWICDSAAYFGGKTMGRNKLYERVSPNKTWEGALWGLIFGILTWIGAKYLVPQLSGLSIPSCFVLGLIVGVFGQIGDLAESLLKRDAGVKDSSSLIPGHGGMLDRIDSILFVAPLTYLYLHLARI